MTEKPKYDAAVAAERAHYEAHAASSDPRLRAIGRLHLACLAPYRDAVEACIAEGIEVETVAGAGVMVIGKLIAATATLIGPPPGSVCKVSQLAHDMAHEETDDLSSSATASLVLEPGQPARDADLREQDPEGSA